MALATYADYKAAAGYANPSLMKAAITTSAGKMFSHWVNTPFAGVAPTTAAICDANTVGAMPWSVPGLAAWIKSAYFGHMSWGAYLIVDRLSHQGGLDATVTTEQTTNLPTAALTRFTSGLGVMMALEIYTQIGATVTTVSCRYTNEAGTGGRVTPLVSFGATGERLPNQMMLMPLQSGDQGVRSVQGVTVTATTGTAGAFGVTLFKPLAMFQAPQLLEQMAWDNVKDMGCFFEPVPTDACLAIIQSAGDTTSGHLDGGMELIKQV
jgi:hypothetical protein